MYDHCAKKEKDERVVSPVAQDKQRNTHTHTHTLGGQWALFVNQHSSLHFFFSWTQKKSATHLDPDGRRHEAPDAPYDVSRVEYEEHEVSQRPVLLRRRVQAHVPEQKSSRDAGDHVDDRKEPSLEDLVVVVRVLARAEERGGDRQALPGEAEGLADIGDVHHLHRVLERPGNVRGDVVAEDGAAWWPVLRRHELAAGLELRLEVLKLLLLHAELLLPRLEVLLALLQDITVHPGRGGGARAAASEGTAGLEGTQAAPPSPRGPALKRIRRTQKANTHRSDIGVRQHKR